MSPGEREALADLDLSEWFAGWRRARDAFYSDAEHVPPVPELPGADAPDAAGQETPDGA